jgi:hypothetical protein
MAATLKHKGEEERTHVSKSNLSEVFQEWFKDLVHL